MKFWHLLILVFAFAAQSCEKNVVIKADFDDYLGSLDTASYTAKVHSLCDSFLLDKSPFAKIYINKPDSIRAFFSNNSNVLNGGVEIANYSLRTLAHGILWWMFMD